MDQHARIARGSREAILHLEAIVMKARIGDQVTTRLAGDGQHAVADHEW
jgi:hypothetical protein